MKPKSDNLFHFTKNIEFLKSILTNGLLPRYCLEDSRWLEVDRNFIAYPMICFCDIPISRISEHTNFYGQYGIGLTKKWGLTNKLTPVIYAPQGSAAIRVADYLFSQNYDGQPDKKEKNDKNSDYIYELITLIKPISGKMNIGGDIVEKDFYQENEWRFIASDADIIFEDEPIENREIANKKLEHQRLQIAPQDIRYIFVKNDYEIPALVDFINTNLGHYPHNDIKLLITRILSIETIYSDI
ncbi:hypothetical protein HU765_19715 [Pseudomonas sp. SWRI81]|uniref:abortive infection system antitoxin AbiGi family protein n=1 Tax=Pseudomonas sp. SWRI81 TaxID=2745505 RepID=UPI0016472715|nr:abortive infection system antitoxin AbiGi family protein [Pseudomonas sp. SWRI81]MBC3272175.1 hypothetical protein [Pseudomonas sp. SWRI81]